MIPDYVFLKEKWLYGFVFFFVPWEPPSNVPIESFDGDFSDEIDEIFTTIAVFVNEHDCLFF